MADGERTHKFRVTTRTYGGEEKTRIEHARFIGLALHRLMSPGSWTLEVEVDGTWRAVTFDDKADDGHRPGHDEPLRIEGVTIGGEG